MPRTIQQQTAITSIIAAATAGGNKHFCLRARAGSGKTSTVMELVSDYVVGFPQHEITLCAFNNAASKELKERLEKRGHTNWRQVNASTIHSLGWGLVRFAFKLERENINEHKVRDLVQAAAQADNAPASVYEQYGMLIRDLVGYAKLEGFGFFPDAQVGDKHAWYRMAAHYDINGFEDTTDMDRVVEAAVYIYKQSLAQTTVIDFDDMILFPLVKNLRVKFQKDLLVIDEAQDTGRARMALLRKFVKPSGVLVVVGDDRQGIYGFAGAQADALDAWISAMDMTVLPLTVSFRCPVAVIKEAQKYVPDIEWAPGAAEGVVATGELPETHQPTDAILCRNTAPLIEAAYKLLRSGIACKVEGRQIGDGLLRMVNRWKRITTIAAYLNQLDDYRAREVQKATAKGNDAKVAEVNDRCDTLVHLCNCCLDKGQASLDDLRAFIGSMFADDVTKSGMVTLCTAHRAKGREWPRVFLLHHHKLFPSPWAKQDWQKRQEENLAYVSITRARETLVYVD